MADWTAIVQAYEEKIANLEQELAGTWKTHHLAITAGFFFVTGLCLGLAL